MFTVCSPYPTLNLRPQSFSSRRYSDLEQSSAAYHICSVTSRLLPSLEDILLRTLLPAGLITVVVPAKWHCHYGHANRSSLLTYMFVTASPSDPPRCGPILADPRMDLPFIRTAMSIRYLCRSCCPTLRCVVSTILYCRPVSYLWCPCQTDDIVWSFGREMYAIADSVAGNECLCNAVAALLVCP